MSDTWIDRVRAADAEAERCYERLGDVSALDSGQAQFWALLAIAAELRAARIARRPGAGQS